MAYFIMLLGGLAWGVIFESIAAVPLKGFYIIPTMIMAAVYAQFPLRLVIGNMCLSAVLGILTLAIISPAFTGGIVPSALFFIHGGVFVVISELFLYGIYRQTLQRY